MQSLNSSDIRKLDTLAQTLFGIPGILLMEHASLNLAKSVLEGLFDRDQGIFILCGKGNNGGDGFAAARHLANFGHKPEIHLVGKMVDIHKESDAFCNAMICQKMGIPIIEVDEVEPVIKRLNQASFTSYLDAVFGTGLDRPLHGIYRELFTSINEGNYPFIAVDLPSGLNADSGMSMGAAIKASQTITFAFSKKGFYEGEGPLYCGEIKVVGIGLPQVMMAEPERFL